MNTTIGKDRDALSGGVLIDESAADAPLSRVCTRPWLDIEVTPRTPGTLTVDILRMQYRTTLQRGE